jgi:hypothetical protein
MDMAALMVWIVTAVGGFVLLGTWVAKGGLRPVEEGGGTRFSPAVLFGHFLLAAAGLLVWIGYVASDSDGLGWAALIILVPVALLGLTMVLRWLGDRRAQPVATASVGGPTGGAPGAGGSAGAAEQAFPVPVVVLHGVLAVTTVVLVLLAVLAS